MADPRVLLSLPYPVQQALDAEMRRRGWTEARRRGGILNEWLLYYVGQRTAYPATTLGRDVDDEDVFRFTGDD